MKYFVRDGKFYSLFFTMTLDNCDAECDCVFRESG